MRAMTSSCTAPAKHHPPLALSLLFRLRRLPPHRQQLGYPLPHTGRQGIHRPYCRHAQRRTQVRAMQLISQYEPHCRGAYGGCVGYIGMDGSLNQAITIRTFVSRNGELWFQAGGGIVAKSDVEYELQEVNNKLGALRAAIEKAAKL